jgi:segregation and condensation protein B
MDEPQTMPLAEEEVTAEAQCTESGETAGEEQLAAEPATPAEAQPPEAAGPDAEVAGSEPAAEAPDAVDKAPDAGDETAALPLLDETQLKAVIEAIIYVAEEPATAAQIANALQCPEEIVKRVLGELTAEYSAATHGVMIREVAGGYKMATKAEHHEAVRTFAKSLKPPLKLSLAALETLATIAYKQPITAPEIMEIRGVQGAGVLKTLLDRKLIQTGGRKNVIGRPILYRTTKDFLVQFGLKGLSELPTLKEFEELRRLAIGEDEISAAPEASAAAETSETSAAVETPDASAAGEALETGSAAETPVEQAASAPVEGAPAETGVQAEVAPSETGEPGDAPFEDAEPAPEAGEIPPENV